MKTRLLLLLAGFLALLTTVATAQCPAGDITLTNQADVDAFPSTYPGCTTVQGNLTIQHTDITNLDSLHYITHVTGGVRIFSNNALTTLSGLKNLTEVDGYFYITANPSLNTLSGLDNLASVGGLMRIQNNIALTTLSNLKSLKMISGGLSIENNSSLTTLQGLEQNTTIGGRLVILSNSKLTTLSGLDNISSVSGRLSITANPKLTTLSSLENISSVGGDLFIYDNDDLTTLSGLENISSLDGELYIYSNDALTTLSGLENIDPTTITELTIWNNSSLYFCDLPNICTYLAGSGPRTISGNSGTCADVMAVNMACLPEVVQIIAPASITAPCGSLAEDLDLPTNVQVTLDDQSTTSIAVTWDVSAYDGTAGTHILPGTLDLMAQATNPGNLTAMLTVVVGSEGAPVMECGESHLVTCDPVVNFDLPMATDQCGPVQVVQTDGTGLTTGSTFPVGTTVLSYRATGTGGTATCTIEVEVLPPLEVNHVAGIAEGDTLHIPTCIPPPIAKGNLDVGLYEPYVSVGGRIFSEDLPSSPIPGMWKINSHEYTVRSVCGTTAEFQHYVALYDLAPPVFQGFPADTTITLVEDLPPVSGKVESLDLCRFVAWDTVTTTAVMDPGTGDTIAFVRRWMVEDEVGNKSFRDQMIYLESYSSTDFGDLTVHVALESDLIDTHFPLVAGTNNIPVRLYRVDTMAVTTNEVETKLSGNWQGQNGRLHFNHLQSGLYRMLIEIPEDYTLIHADSLFSRDGWSDTLSVQNGKSWDLGTLLLIPASGTVEVDTVLQSLQMAESQSSFRPISAESFLVYPNPASGLVKIETTGIEEFEYEVYNQVGQVVKAGKGNHETDIDLRHQMSGIYVIQLRKGHQYLGSKRILLLKGK